MDVRDFLPHLHRIIQGPLETAMADSLMTSAVSFCKQGQVLRDTVDAGTVAAGDKVQIVATDATWLPWSTVKVVVDGGELERDIDYEQTSRDVVTFLKEAEGVKILACFYPTDKKKLPDKLMAYETSICNGAAAELYAMPNKAWSNGELSMLNQRRFTQGHRDAWREIESDQFGGFQNPTVNVSYWM